MITDSICSIKQGTYLSQGIHSRHIKYCHTPVIYKASTLRIYINYLLLQQTTLTNWHSYSFVILTPLSLYHHCIVSQTPKTL